MQASVKKCACGNKVRKAGGRLCGKCYYSKFGHRIREINNSHYRNNPDYRAKKIAYSKQHREQELASGILVCERTVMGWLGKVLSGIKRARLNQGIDFSITKFDLMAIWFDQGGKCALTGIEMDKKRRSPYSASIDRIDPNKAYSVDNVQLVCMAANYAKCSFSQDQIVEFFAKVRAVALAN